MFDPEVLSNLYLDFKNSKDLNAIYIENLDVKLWQARFTEIKNIISSLAECFRTRYWSSYNDVDGYHRKTFFESLKC